MQPKPSSEVPLTDAEQAKRLYKRGDGESKIVTTPSGARMMATVVLFRGDVYAYTPNGARIHGAVIAAVESCR